MVLQGLGGGEEVQTDRSSFRWGFLGSSFTCISWECCCTVRLCPKHCGSARDRFPSHKPLPEWYCRGENKSCQVDTTVLLTVVSCSCCAAVVPSSWWGHRYTPFTIQQFCSCYSSFWDPGTVFGQSMDLKQVAKCCCIFMPYHQADAWSGWQR